MKAPSDGYFQYNKANSSKIFIINQAEIQKHFPEITNPEAWSFFGATSFADSMALFLKWDL
jgi:hypothetical protein